MKWWLLLALAGCGDNAAPPTTAEPRSGSRLRLERVVYADGTRQLAGPRLRDALRDEPCTIEQWSDGRRYCTPETFRTLYLDAACTHEAARQRSVEPERGYALHEFFVAGAALPSRLYHLGAELPRGEIAAAFELRGGGCLELHDLADQDRFFELGDEVDRGELVHAIREEVPGDDRVTALVDTSADGLQLPVALFDTDQARTCTLSPRQNKTLACEPAGVVSSDRFADPACAVPVIVVNASREVPDLTRRQHGLACDTFHPVGELLLVDPTYTKSGAVCTEASLGIGDRVFALGAEIELATVERVRVPGPGRLQLIEDGASHFPDLAVFDTERGEDCIAGVARSSELRCLPALERPRDVFRDPACEVPALTIEVASICGRRAPVLAQDSHNMLYPVLEPAEVYERSTAKICAPAIPAFGGVFHRVGEAIERAAFVPAERRFD